MEADDVSGKEAGHQKNHGKEIQAAADDDFEGMERFAFTERGRKAQRGRHCSDYEDTYV
ncbi:hypothetical protein OZX73_04820 [Bifidobacterium sp. ESL0775]|uniref:hypothetical protein n=1 Tax=Bifidobacterium sp. ESL0775 TaxID=2983230 RepID=UPI0023F9165B|nr:hypothetical protein [Bifidobacterium sp. ESL0775]WEV68619.1 hypothetical protein OZX73_04820 [Bifidobacterium sp. ESL0775]